MRRVIYVLANIASSLLNNIIRHHPTATYSALWSFSCVKTKLFQLEPLWKVHQWKDTVALTLILGLIGFSNHVVYVRVENQVVPDVIFGMVRSTRHAFWHNLDISFQNRFRNSLRWYRSILWRRGDTLGWLPCRCCNEILLQSPQMLRHEVNQSCKYDHVTHCHTNLWFVCFGLETLFNVVCLQFFVARPPFFQRSRRQQTNK